MWLYTPPHLTDCLQETISVFVSCFQPRQRLQRRRCVKNVRWWPMARWLGFLTTTTTTTHLWPRSWTSCHQPRLPLPGTCHRTLRIGAALLLVRWHCLSLLYNGNAVLLLVQWHHCCLSFLYDGTAASPIIQLDLLSPLLGSTWSRSEQLRCENPERIENCDRL